MTEHSNVAEKSESRDFLICFDAVGALVCGTIVAESLIHGQPVLPEFVIGTIGFGGMVFWLVPKSS